MTVLCEVCVGRVMIAFCYAPRGEQSFEFLDRCRACKAADIQKMQAVHSQQQQITSSCRTGLSSQPAPY